MRLQVPPRHLPSLVRGPQLERFKASFTNGSQLYRSFNGRLLTDPQIDDLCKRTDQWANDTFGWLKKDVSEYAAERFLFRQPRMAMSFNLPGEHQPGYADMWGNCYQALAALLSNLDQLMRDPSIYPEQPGDND